MPVPLPSVELRTRWNAKPFDGQPVPQPRYDTVTVHHAAGFDAATLSEARRQVRAIQTLHQDRRGWSDIGYHFLIDAGGRIFQGRPFANGSAFSASTELTVGAHVQGRNRGNIGVCLLGCFHPPTNDASCIDILTPDRFSALSHLVAYLCERHGIAVDRILTHGEQGNTDCPGNNVRRRMDELRRSVQDRLDGNDSAPPGAPEDPGDHVPLVVTDGPKWLKALGALGEPDLFGASAVTARQDGLAAGFAASEQMARTDLERANLLKADFRFVSAATDMPAAVLAAIASRESRVGNVLASDGTGDGGNAFGIMQIDFRFHTPVGEARSVEHILQAAELLKSFVEQVARKHPSWSDAHKLKGGVVAYNVGVGNVQTIPRMDQGSTGDDYGSDVLVRAQFFARQGFV